MLRGEGFVVFKRPFRWQECQVWSGCIVAGELAGLLAEIPVVDLTVEDPPIEEVIDRVFQGSKGEVAAS